MGAKSEAEHLERILGIMYQRGLTRLVQHRLNEDSEAVESNFPIQTIMGQYCYANWVYDSAGNYRSVSVCQCSDAQVRRIDGRYLFNHDVLEWLYIADTERVSVDVFNPYLATCEVFPEVVHCGIRYRVEYTGDTISIRHSQDGKTWSLPQYWSPTGTVFSALLGLCRENKRLQEIANEGKSKDGIRKTSTA